jgi:two-component system cell cycle response regulator DivK
MSAKTILYVEDNEPNRMIVRDLLKRTTYNLIEAYDGEAGVAMALERRPDMILMDIQLPKISGLEAIRRLRAEPTTAATPIVAITSFALNGDDKKAKDAGATAYLTKPYSPYDLLKLIRNIIPEPS